MACKTEVSVSARVLMAICLGLAALPAQAAEYGLLDGVLPAGERCTQVSDGQLVRTPGSVVLRTLGSTTSFGQGKVQFSIMGGGLDAASSIRLLDLPGATLTVLAKHSAATNRARGCGPLASVDLQIVTSSPPTAARNGRLRLEFGAAGSVRGPLEIVLRQEPVPMSLRLIWPYAFAASAPRCFGQGGYIRNASSTSNVLEIGLDPQLPLPAGCAKEAVQVNVNYSRPVLIDDNMPFGTYATAISGLPAAQAAVVEAVTRTDASTFRFMGSRIGETAFHIDYVALRQALLTAGRTASTPSTRPAMRSAGATKSRAAASQAPAEINFTVEMSRFNGRSGLHAPMPVRIVAIESPARGAVAAPPPAPRPEVPVLRRLDVLETFGGRVVPFVVTGGVGPWRNRDQLRVSVGDSRSDMSFYLGVERLQAALVAQDNQMGTTVLNLTAPVLAAGEPSRTGPVCPSSAVSDRCSSAVTVVAGPRISTMPPQWQLQPAGAAPIDMVTPFRRELTLTGLGLVPAGVTGLTAELVVEDWKVPVALLARCDLDLRVISMTATRIGFSFGVPLGTRPAACSDADEQAVLATASLGASSGAKPRVVMYWNYGGTRVEVARWFIRGTL